MYEKPSQKRDMSTPHCTAVQNAFLHIGCCPDVSPVDAPQCTWNATREVEVEETNRWSQFLGHMHTGNANLQDTAAGKYFDFTPLAADPTLCPFVFAHSLRHDPVHHMPYCSDAVQLAEVAACPTVTGVEGLPREANSNAYFYGLTDASLPVATAVRASDGLPPPNVASERRARDG